MERVQKVLANCEQGLNSTEKAQARRNIDAQASLTAGANVQIDQSTNTISATDTTYTAGANVQISSSNVISATDTTYSAGTNITIDANNVISAAAAPQVQADWNQTNTQAVDFIKNKPSISEITKTMHGPDTDYTTHVDTLDVDIDNYQLSADGSAFGLYAPYVGALSFDRVLTLPANGTLPYWAESTKGVFVAYYSGYSTGHGNTPFADIKAAYDEGKAVFAKYTLLGGDVWMVLDQIDSARAVFSRCSGSMLNNTYGNVVSSILVVYASDNSYTLKDASLVYSGGTGIDIDSNNVISSDIYVAEIYTENNVNKCNFAAINSASTAGKLVLLKREGDGSFLGKLKYISNGMALFDNFYAQPMRMSETFVHSDNSVEYQTLYVYDNTLTNTYRATRYGTSFWQANVSNMSWIPSYMNTASDVQWYSGEAGTTAVTLTDLWNAIRNTTNYQVLKVFVTGSVCHARHDAPSGTPLGFLRIRFKVGRYNIAAGTSEFVEIAESPYAHIDCDNYTAISGGYTSEWHQFSLEMTIDRYRLQTLGFNSSYSDQSIAVAYDLVNEVPGGSVHDLGIRNMTMKFTLLTHL